MDSPSAVYANVGRGVSRKTAAFKKIHLYKDQTLGIGSYGKVCRAKCDDLVCAAKVMHETLFDPSTSHLVGARKEHRLPIKRFEKECDFLSTLRHPNIIQYLNVYIDPDTGLPALLMELMDSNLTKFLENSPQPIAFHIQVNLCHDVALALSFLHSNSIIHRDLSSNNVLLIGSIRAKVTDFGMARLGELSSQSTYTMCPGTDCYMPPEAVKEQPEYSEKIDCFSYGVIVVQMLTREFPKPGNRRKEVEMSHPGLPTGTFEIRVSEIERRENHISKIDPDHPLLQVALDCLNDKDVKRPFAHELCERVAVLKESADYTSSERPAVPLRAAVKRSESVADEDFSPQSFAAEVEGLKRVIYLQTTQLEEKELCIKWKDRNMASAQDEAKQLSERCEWIQHRLTQYEEEITSNQLELKRLDAFVQQKDDLINERDSQLREQVETSENVIAQFEERIHELEQQLVSLEEYQLSERERHVKTRTSMDGEHTTAGIAQGDTDLKLRWREGPKAPYRMSSFHSAAVEGNTIFIKLGGKEVYECRGGREWSQLPNCPVSNCPLVVVNKRLTLVGGSQQEVYSNKLFSLVGEGSVARKRWSEEFPPMPTKRSNATAICTGSSLIVAGGQGKEAPLMKVVEVMNTWTHQWSTAACLPEPMWAGSAAMCGDCVYMLGEKDTNRSAFVASLSVLLHSCKSSKSSTLTRRRAKHSSKESSSVWRRVASLPSTWCACVSTGNHLLLIGGMNEDNRPITDIRVYNATSDSWEVIGHMLTARRQCFAAVVRDDRLIVVGGITDSGDTTNTVEMATVVK